MNKLEQDNLNNFLFDQKIKYFSCTVFENKKNKELISWCNNNEWIKEYVQTFKSTPPVKKYIVLKKSGLLWWDEDLYDKETNEFIQKRNDICETKMICTFVPKYKNTFSAISFGSDQGQSHLIEIIEDNSSKRKLNELFKSLICFTDF